MGYARFFMENEYSELKTKRKSVFDVKLWQPKLYQINIWFQAEYGGDQDECWRKLAMRREWKAVYVPAIC